MKAKTNAIEAFRERSWFVSTLVLAELNARTSWECEFTNDIRAMFEKHDTNTALTATQIKQIRQLAAKN